MRRFIAEITSISASTTAGGTGSLIDMTESGTLARVVFDESHNEAWTIRPELARAMQPAHPGRFLLRARRRGAGRARLRGAPQRRAAADRGDAARLRGAGDRPSVGPDVGAHDRHRLAAAEPARRSTRSRQFVAAGGGLVVLGETEQEKYGNNLNELLARFGLHLENDTVQDYEHCRSAPSWILADLARGRPWARRRSARARERGLPVPGHDDLLEQRRHRAGAHARHGVLAGAAADRGRHARPGPGGRAGRLGPVRRRLHRRARSPRAVAEHRLLGGRARTAAPGRSRRARPGARARTRPGSACATRPTRWRRCRRRTARWPATRTRRAGTWTRMIARDRGAGAAVPARRGVPARGGRGPAGVGLRQARLHAGARAVPPGAPARATGSSTSSCSRCTSRTARATRASRR